MEMHTHYASKSVPMDGMSLTEVSVRMCLCLYTCLHLCMFVRLCVRGSHCVVYVCMYNGDVHALRQQIRAYGWDVPDRGACENVLVLT
jgi:hypothetical protein